MSTSYTWRGQYFDGHSPIALPVSIDLTSDGLIIRDVAGHSLVWPYEEIRQTQGHYEGEEIRMERPNDRHDLLVVANATFLTDLHYIAPHRVKHLHNPHARTRRAWLTVAAGFLVIPLIWLVYAKGVPALARPITHIIPYSWESHLGHALAEQIAPPEKRCTDSRLLEKTHTFVQTLATKVNSAPYTFRLSIVDKPIRNALALPGGHIMIFRGLLKSTKTPEEFAGVVAHEMQHILERHGLHLLVQHLSLDLIIGALTGESSGLMAVVLEGAHVFQSLSYSRSAEYEADRKGLALLVEAGINPEGMLSFFEYLKEQHGKKEPDILFRYLSTHPTPGDRIAKLRHQAETASHDGYDVFPLDHWQQITGLCHEKGQ